MDKININITPYQLASTVQDLLTLSPGATWEWRTKTAHLKIRLSKDGRKHVAYFMVEEWMRQRAEVL